MIVPKTLNAYWIFGTAIMVWFLFLHSPPYLYQRFHNADTLDIPFALHLQGAYTITIVCIINSLITPSSTFGGSNARNYHIWIGRIGMICGISSFLWGLYCSWWPYRTNLPPLSFSIAISLGGIGQLFGQYIGYTGICQYKNLKVIIKEKRELLLQQHESTSSSSSKPNRKELVEEIQQLEEKKIAALKKHIDGMIGLFYMGCGVPAFMRLIMAFYPNAGTSSVLLSVLFLNVIVHRYINYLIATIVPPPPPNNASKNSNEIVSSPRSEENTNLLARS